MSEHVPEKTAYAMLAYAGSNEMIGLTLGVMQPRVDYHRSLLHEEVMGLQGDDPVYKLHEDRPFDYCETSLSRVGFVARSIDSTRHRLAVLGEEIGKPLVGKLLKLSAEVGPAQAAIIGPRGYSGAKHAIENRILLLRKFVQTEGQPINSAACKKLLKTAAVPTRLLQALDTSGILCYESSGRKAVIKNLPGPQFSELKISGRTLSRQAVIIALQQAFGKEPERALSNADIVAVIHEAGLPYEEGISDDKLASRVHEVTQHLRLRNILSKMEVAPGETGGATVWLTATQLVLATRLVNIFDGLLKPTPSYLKSGREALDEIMDPGNREIVRKLVGKATNASVQSQKYQEARDDFREDVKRFLEQSGEKRKEAVLEKQSREVKTPTEALGSPERVERAQPAARIHKVDPAQVVERIMAWTGDPRPATPEEKMALAELWSTGKRREWLADYIRRHIPDPDSVEDVVVNILISLMTANFTIPLQTKERGWVYSITSKRVNDHLRKYYKAKRYEEKFQSLYGQDRITPTTEEEAHNGLERKALQSLLAEVYSQTKLTPRQKSVLELELANPEINTLEGADQLGITTSAYRLARAKTRNALRKALAQRLQEAAAEGMYIPPGYLKLSAALTGAEEGTD